MTSTKWCRGIAEDATRPEQQRRSFWPIVAGVALAASLFRFALARYSLWFDEQASMFFAGRPLANLWSGWMVREPNPPLYYSLLKGWIAIFGDSAQAARALSIAAGAGAVLASAGLARQVYGREAGLIAAGLTAISAQQLYYAMQARSYECVYLAACGALIALVAIERAWRRGQAWTPALPGYALGCILCIYLHTTMFLLPVICTLAILMVRWREVMARPGLLLPLMIANLVVALASGWWLDITLRQMLAGTQNGAVFDQVTPWLIVRETIGVLSFAQETGVLRIFIAVVVTLFVVVRLRGVWAMAETRLLAAVIGVTVVLLGLISVAVPVFLPRTIYWLSAISTAFCAVALAGLQRRARWALPAIAALVLVNMATSVAGRETEDWDGAVRRGQAVPGARLIVQGEAMALLLQEDCARLNRGRCLVPVIAVMVPDDRLDRWAAGLYTGPKLAVGEIDRLPEGAYFVFRKAFYHDLVKTLKERGRARLVRGDPVLLGPVRKAMLVE